MSYSAPTVNYSATIDGTYTSLPGVQSVSINGGRQRFQDNFPHTNCVIDLIPTDAFSSLTPLAVGQFIDVRDANTDVSPCYFAGIITDVSRKFSIPFNAVTGAAPGDRIVITAAGGVGVLGQASLTNEAFIVENVKSSLDQVCNNNNIFAFAENPNVFNSAFTFTGGLLDLVNGLLRTAQMMASDLDLSRINPAGEVAGVYFFQPGTGNKTFDFTDDASFFNFVALEYLSSVQNYFTEVNVVPENLATQTEVSGLPPYNSLTYNTYSRTTVEASNLAQFIIATQNLVEITPFTITTNTRVSPTCLSIAEIPNLKTFLSGTRSANLGSAVSLSFRGTVVEAIIQGVNTTFYPDYASVQLYLSPSLGAPFVLDSATFGVLDQNKLGL
jgi:hypothetical protein